MNHNREVNSLQKMKLYYEGTEERSFFMGVAQRLRRRREEKLKRREERAKDTKQNKK